MKKLGSLVVILAFVAIIYFFWANKIETENINPIAERQKVTVVKKKNPPKIQELPTNIQSSKEMEVKNYISKLNRTIKTQYKELEECEKEFDVHFGDLLEMNEKKKLEYISDPNNLEALLDKFSSINFTTPSSAKVLKEFANPVSEQVKITEVYHKPGLQDRVEICSPRGKKDILNLLYKSKIKKKAIMRALLEYFENENATLDLPYILFDQILELKKLLKFQGIPESRYPKLGKIEKEFKIFDKKIMDLLNTVPPRKYATLDYQEAKMEYEYALKLQADIKSLLRKISEDAI
jgi:hypothetical protein